MAVDSGQPGGQTDEVSSSSSTSAVEAGHDKILTHAPVPGTIVDDASTFSLAEQADDASKPVAEQTFGENGCQPERSEGSGTPDAEILRCAQADSPETPVFNPVTPIPSIAAVQAVNVTVKMPALDPETPAPNPVTPMPEIALVEQAGQLQVEEPDWGAGLVPPLREVAEVWAMLDEVARVEMGARYSGRGAVVEERRHLPVYAPHKTLLADASRRRQRRQFRLRYSARKHMRVARVKEQRGHKRFWVTLASVALALLVVCLSLGGATAYVAYRFYHTTRVTFVPKILTLRDLLPLDNLKIYDSTGVLIDQLTGNGIHTTVTYEQVSPYLRNATVATEDKNFWNNPGVDVLGIIRASLTDLEDGRKVEGGSTITQQLIKNLVVGNDPTIVRKLEEIILAPQLNDNYSKRDILTMYLNSIYYGHQAYGIDAAATVFFGLQDQAGRSAAAQLDLAQAAMLAGLPRNPSEYDPAVNFQSATDRFETVLTLMVKQGYISNVDKYDAIHEEQGPDFFKFGTALQNRAPHFVNFVLAQLQKMFNIHNPAELSRSGMVVYTTLDVNLQDKIQKIAQQHIAELRETNHVTNAAEVLIDFHTGAIISLLGSIDYNNNAIDGQYDVTQAYRQPGSSFKPYVYVTAFEQGASPAQAINDAPIHIPVPNSNPSTFSPSNYDNKFHGHMTLRCALQNSLNVPGVKVLQHVGIDAAMQTANNMGITSYRGTPGYSLVLGGLGVRLIDHTSAMGVFANGGVREPYYAINKVVSGASGSVLYQHQVDPGTQVISPQLAYMMTNVLSDNTDRTPEFFDCNALQLYANSQQDCWHGNRGAVRPAAAKTGTTNDFRDNWTVGYTTDYVMGVWVGNDDNSPMINVSGISGAAPIWHDAMLLAEQGHAIQDFVDPGGLVQATVTYPDGVKTTDWFLPGTVPTFHKTPTPSTDAIPSPSPSPAADPGDNPSNPAPTPYCPASYSFAFAPPPANAPAPDPGWW
jgi:1A family penicillin-binding protein